MSEALEIVRLTVAPEERAAFLRERPMAITALRRRFGGLLAEVREMLHGEVRDLVRMQGSAT